MDDFNGIAIGKRRIGKGRSRNDVAVAFHNDYGGIIAACPQHSLYVRPSSRESASPLMVSFMVQSPYEHF